ncbi:MAG: hypothetical protein IJS94_00185 [Clostridia bacterium]|nr:hypothetical protein [Clostridia bacterium]
MHILLFDIIYSSQRYDFYADMTFDPINAKARKLYYERVAKAKELSDRVDKLRADSKKLKEAVSYVKSSLTKGMPVKHRFSGEGVVDCCDGFFVSVYLTKKNESVSFELVRALESRFLSISSEEVEQKIKSYIPYLKQGNDIQKKLKSAEDALQPYIDYL